MIRIIKIHPALAGALASLYNGAFDLTSDDTALLLDLVDAYVVRERPWIAGMSRDEWRSDLYVLVHALTRAVTLGSDAGRARDVLTRLATSAADRDTKKAAQKLLANL